MLEGQLGCSKQCIFKCDIQIITGSMIFTFFYTGMFTAAFTLMNQNQWESCPSTTNPVESINRESIQKDGHVKSLTEVLSHIYRMDRVYAARKVAALHHVTTSYRSKTPLSRETRNTQKRKWRRSINSRKDEDHDAQGTNWP